MNLQEVAIELARESAAEQGFPEFIEDPEVLAQEAALTAQPEEAEQRASA